MIFSSVRSGRCSVEFKKQKRALFIDRDGVLVKKGHKNRPEDIRFMEGVFTSLKAIQDYTDYALVLVSNQDGVGTPALPREVYEKAQDLIMGTIAGEGIFFSDINVDFSLPEDHCPGRKPGKAMLESYENGEWDLASSFVIGDRKTDMELARSLGARGIWFGNESVPEELRDTVMLTSESWNEIASFLTGGKVKKVRRATLVRNTNETGFEFDLSLDGTGKGRIITGIGFFDHMTEQIVKHSGIDLSGTFRGDLEVDEHHSVEDFAITLGQLMKKALGDKRGINRYGSDILIMDDVVATVALDFSGRAEFIYDVDFRREHIGTFPTEMIQHFFKSFSNAAECNLYLHVTQGNSHHMAEALFKAFARSIKVAVKRNPASDELPSTKGVL